MTLEQRLANAKAIVAELEAQIAAPWPRENDAYFHVAGPPVEYRWENSGGVISEFSNSALLLGLIRPTSAEAEILCDKMILRESMWKAAGGNVSGAGWMVDLSDNDVSVWENVWAIPDIMDTPRFPTKEAAQNWIDANRAEIERLLFGGEK